MRRRQTRRRSLMRVFRRSDDSPWPIRLALAVITIAAVLIGFAVVSNMRRHDALTKWRAALEAAAGRPSWPAWSSAWPELPAPRGRKRILVDLRGPYAFAATHKELLEHIPCYCGCVRDAHRSNLSCFITKFRQDGTPIWTDHSYTCEMCVHIAREVMLMSFQGMSVNEMRGAIDRRYAHWSHRPTNTPLPSHQTSHRQ